jgi:hypothetical protein
MYSNVYTNPLLLLLLLIIITIARLEHHKVVKEVEQQKLQIEKNTISQRMEEKRQDWLALKQANETAKKNERESLSQRLDAWRASRAYDEEKKHGRALV